MEIHVVQRGDTVSAIATAYGVEQNSIIYINQLVEPYQLAVGQALLIDRGTRELFRPSMSTLGYAYPFISPWVLEQTLPYLSELAVFSYGFTEDGRLVPPSLDDTWMIQRTCLMGVAPILTLTPLNAEGNFSNVLINCLVNRSASVQQLIGELKATMAAKGYRGLDIDFEYILEADRDAYTAFVLTLTQAMHQEGYTVTVALAPKSSARYVSPLTDGLDYAALGAAVDHVLVMTYEWGYTYGPPMAVAPLPQVRQVMEYALTQIPREKLRMGIPNYGYDWTLPFVQGESRARTLGNVEAAAQAAEVGVEIQFDETAQAPFYHYAQEGNTHEVWFEDARSLRAKYGLMEELGLEGAGVWQIMQLFRAMWILAAGTFRLQK